MTIEREIEQMIRAGCVFDGAGPTEPISVTPAARKIAEWHRAGMEKLASGLADDMLAELSGAHNFLIYPTDREEASDRMQKVIEAAVSRAIREGAE